jgi:NAD(P)-dependent dehydrogenase (short-subunit alcohol dehydrogenase family)
LGEYKDFNSTHSVFASKFINFDTFMLQFYRILKQKSMHNKIALVTGGSRGLGKDMALSLAKNGHHVIITYQTNKEGANETVKVIKAMKKKAVAIKLDLTTLKGLDAFIANVSKVLQSYFNADKFDFLINNAGMGATIPFVNATEAQFDAFMNVHFKGIYFLTQKALPLLNDGASIVNISTGTTRFALPGYSMYAGMKSALETFSRYAAKELGNRKIRVNVVAPGPIETDFNNAGIRNNPQMKAHLSTLSPLGRVGAADDIGSVVAFLCSDEAKWINGQRIEVSGGINL